MNVELTRVMIDTRSLARERGWERVVEAADAVLASHPENALMLVSPPEIEFGGLPRWIKDTAPALEIAKSGTGAFAANPLLAAEAERLVVVFEVGRLMTADTIDIVQQVCFSRPEGSYKIVLRGAEALDSEEDREIFERGVFRLLVPDPKGEWHGQDLAPHNCYLWCDSASPEFLAEKIARDKAAFAGWLRTPTRHSEALALQQAFDALELADQAASRTAAPAAEQPVLTASRVFTALNELSDLRRRLLARVDAEAPSIERQLGASLQTLEQDLLQGAHAYVVPRLSHFDPSRDEARLGAVVTEYIALAARNWKERAEAILISRSAELQTDLDAILHALDWKVVNAAATSSGSGGDYPDALLENLPGRNGAGVSLGDPVLEALSGDRRRKSAATICGMLAVAAIGHGVYMLGLGPFGLAAAGVGLVAGLVKYKDDSARYCDEFARAAIQATFRETIAAVQHHVRESLKPVRSGVTERFRILEAMLDGALATLRSADGAAPAEDPDRAAIAALRLRVAAIVAQEEDSEADATAALHHAPNQPAGAGNGDPRAASPNSTTSQQVGMPLTERNSGEDLSGSSGHGVIAEQDDSEATVDLHRSSDTLIATKIASDGESHPLHEETPPSIVNLNITDEHAQANDAGGDPPTIRNTGE